jgi:hypothetical protein
MSRRNSREALLQDELLNAVQIGLAAQRNDLAERSFSAEITRQSFDLEQQRRVENARTAAMTELASVDPLAPDAFDRVQKVRASYGGVLPAAEFRAIVDPIEKEVTGYRSLAEQIKATSGVAPVVGKDGRYDFEATRQQARELEHEYATGLNPTVRGAMERSQAFTGMSLSEKVTYGRRHQEAEQILDWALSNDLVSYDDVMSRGGLYLDGGNVSEQPLIDGSGSAQPVRAGHIFDLRAVQGLKTADGRNLGAAFRQAQDARSAMEQQNAFGETQAKQAKTEIELLGSLNTFLSGESAYALSPEERAVIENLVSKTALNAAKTVDQAGAARVAGAGVLPVQATTTRADVTNTQAAQASAARNPVPLPIGQVPANRQGQFSVGQTFTDPSGVVYIITE